MNLLKMERFFYTFGALIWLQSFDNVAISEDCKFLQRWRLTNC